MKLLSIETSTLVASVAVTVPDLLADVNDPSGNHSDRLIGLIDSALQQSGLAMPELDAIVVGAGPGSFTGLRIGMATAKGLAFAAEKKLLAVSSLAALAVHTAKRRPNCLVIALADARRKEVFAGYYRFTEGALQCVAPEEVLTPARVGGRIKELGGLAHHNAVLIGDAIGLYPELATADYEVVDPSAKADAVGVAMVAEMMGSRDDGVASAVPIYIRPSEAEIKFPDGNPGGTFASFAATAKNRQ